MKRCPACSRVYDDFSPRFCLDDGAELVNKVGETAPATAVLPSNNLTPTIEARPPEVASVPSGLPPTVAPFQPNKRSVYPWVLGGTALLLVLGVGITIALIWLPAKQSLPWHLVLQVEPATGDRGAVVSQTVSIIESRLNAVGVHGFEVHADGDPSSGRILVNLPGLPNPERIKNLISSRGKLELVRVLSPPSPAPVQSYATKEEATASLNSGGAVPGNRRVLPDLERDESGVTAKWVVVESPAIVDGSDLKDASVIRSSPGKSYDIVFSLKKFGAEKFGTWTSSNINNYLGVVLNDEIKSIAFIRSPISDQGVISGHYSKEAAEDLALVLRSGALPAPIKFVAERVDR
jgi:protein-export membrane protein SecD